MKENVNRDNRGEKPLISVVIVNWNTREELARCLDSLFKNHPGLDIRITVVDNASSDGSAGMLRDEFPRINLIANRDNRGFAAANNQAFAQLDRQSRFVLVLNPDIVFTRNTLQPLVDFLQSRPDVHVVTPRILNPEGSIQRGCRRRDPRPLMMLSSLLGLSCLFPKTKIFSGYTYGDIPEELTHEVEAASGSFLFFRREVLDGVGGFDERFFLYAEDLDWCLRVRKKGFSIYYYPQTSVVHQRAASSAQRPLSRLWHMHYTAFLYIVKNQRQEYPVFIRSFLYLALACRLALMALILPFQLLGKALCKAKEKRQNADIED